MFEDSRRMEECLEKLILKIDVEDIGVLLHTFSKASVERVNKVSGRYLALIDVLDLPDQHHLRAARALWTS